MIGKLFLDFQCLNDFPSYWAIRVCNEACLCITSKFHSQGQDVYDFILLISRPWIRTDGKVVNNRNNE